MANKYAQFSKVNSKESIAKREKEADTAMKGCLKKKRYNTQGYADGRIDYYKKKGFDKDMRSYYCALCDGYHLTSRMFQL